MSSNTLDTHLTFDLNDLKYAKSVDIVIGKHIGKGVFSDVFVVKHRSDKAVLKITYKNKISKNTLNEEIRVSDILRTKDHKNVVKIKEILENSKRTQSWFIMEWISGQDMKQVMKQQNRAFDEKVAKIYFRQLIDGLNFLHSINIVHRDIKPNNILIGTSDSPNPSEHTIKYIDFGFAKFVDVFDKKAICDSHKGSQVYMAPELMSNKTSEYDAFKTDIYSLAIVLYEMLFNCLPFGTSDMGVDEEDRNELMIALKENLILKYPDELDVSEEVKQLIERMIAKDSDKRLSIQEIQSSNWFQNNL